jgi:hypothetical protein
MLYPSIFILYTLQRDVQTKLKVFKDYVKLLEGFI